MTDVLHSSTAHSDRPFGATDEWGTLPFALKRHVSPHGQITAVSMMKDEGPFVLEWVAHHLAVGFTDLVVYTNDCSDGTDDMLMRLETLGLCHHRRNNIPEGIRPQPSALAHAQDEPVIQQSDWVMVFDADEFLSIRYGKGSLDELISATKANGANGIVVTWRIFGSGGLVDWSAAPVTEQYLMAAPQTWNKGWGVKTLFEFDPEYWKLGIHRPKMKNKHFKTDFPDSVKWVTGSGNQMEDYFKFRGWRSITRTVGYDWVQLNHYAIKSVESYAIRKLRGNVNNKADKYNSDYWSLQDRNEVRDETMLRYSAVRNKIIAQLLSDPELQRLHTQAINKIELRLADLRKTDAYRDLVLDLAIASHVPITQIVAKPPQPRDKEKIAALMSDVEKKRNEGAKSTRKLLPKDPLLTIPMGTYVDGKADLATDVPVDWHTNHSMKLPADQRIFNSHAIQLIQNGKFERGVARRLPQVLPRDATVLEIGSAVGFVAAHCANLRPDITMIMQESNPTLRSVLRQVCEVSERSFDNKFLLDKSVLAYLPSNMISLFKVYCPDVLVMADAGVAPRILQGMLQGLSANLPKQVFFYGRFMEQWHASMGDIAMALAEHSYIADFGFDPNVARGFRLAGASARANDAQ